MNSSKSQNKNKDTRALIYGFGGHAREICFLLESMGQRPTAFIDDANPKGQYERLGVDVVSFEKAAALADIVYLGIGNGRTRKKLATKCKAEGFRLPALHPFHPHLQTRINIGEGSVVCEGVTMTIDIRIGQHVHINRGCNLSHDDIFEDFVTLGPGVNVSGHVHIREGATVGTGVSIINGTPEKPIVIGAGSTIGAGSVVIDDVPENATVVGVPSRRVH